MERRRYVAPILPHAQSNIRESLARTKSSLNHESLKRQRDREGMAHCESLNQLNRMRRESFDGEVPFDFVSLGSTNSVGGKKRTDLPISTRDVICNESTENKDTNEQYYGASSVPVLLHTVGSSSASLRLQSPRLTQEDPKDGDTTASHDITLSLPKRSYMTLTLPAFQGSCQIPGQEKAQHTEAGEGKTENDKNKKHKEKKVYDPSVVDSSDSHMTEPPFGTLTSITPFMQHHADSLGDFGHTVQPLHMTVQLDLDHLPLSIESHRKVLKGNFPNKLDSEFGCNKIDDRQRETKFHHFRSTIDSLFGMESTLRCCKRKNSRVMSVEMMFFHQVGHEHRGRMFREMLNELPGLPKLATYDHTHCPFRARKNVSFTDAFHDHIQRQLTTRVLYPSALYQTILQQWPKEKNAVRENCELDGSRTSTLPVTLSARARIRRWSKDLLLEGIVDHVQLGKCLVKSPAKVKGHLRDQPKEVTKKDTSFIRMLATSDNLQKKVVPEQVSNPGSAELRSDSAIPVLGENREEHNATHIRIVNLLVDAYVSERNARSSSLAEKLSKCEDTARGTRKLLQRVLQFHEQAKDLHQRHQSSEYLKTKRRLLHPESVSSQPRSVEKHYS